MKQMPYSQLQKIWLFSLLAESGSFKVAAAQAGVSTSALSQALAALEARLQVTLVVRSRNAIKVGS